MSIILKHKKKIVLLGLMIIGLSYWGTRSKPEPEPAPTIKVVVLDSTAQKVTQDLKISGHTKAARIVTLRAETSGRIESIPAQRGQNVKAQQDLVLLGVDDRPARLAEAKARLVQREKEFKAGTQLTAKAFRAENALSAQEAELASARASLAKIEREITNTRIVAPFDGVYEQQFVEMGDFVNVGDKIGVVAELNPLCVVCHVAEKDILTLENEAPVQVKFAHLSETLTGSIHFVSQIADPKTRTFPIEVLLTNGNSIPGGITAEVILNKGEVWGHAISPSALSLNDEGIIGVKTVEEGVVLFRPVKILSSSKDSVLVADLPEKVQIIAVGGDFVAPGQPVETAQARSS